MDYGSQCMSFFKFIITDGQENQAYSSHWHVEFDWIVAFVQKRQVKFKWEEERPFVGTETGQEILFKKH